jgi:hypothetical protein
MILLFLILAICVCWYTLSYKQLILAVAGLNLISLLLTFLALFTLANLAFFFVFSVLLILIHF